MTKGKNNERPRTTQKQRDAAMDMLSATAQGGEIVAEGDEDAEADPGPDPDPAKATKAPKAPDPLDGLTFVPETSDKFRGNRSFYKFEAEGQTLTYTVDKLVSEEEAEASPDGAPLFHGIYVREYPSGDELIMSAYHQLWEYFADMEQAEIEAHVFQTTRKAEKQLKGGRSVIEFRMAKAVRP